MTNMLPETEQWYSLTKAAKLLGIHSTTLRRWADSGQIPFMLTPGGHRRFAYNDLQKFTGDRHYANPTNSFEQQWAEHALTQTRQVIVANRNEPWMAQYDDDTREQHRILGRRLMGLTLQYISDVNETAFQSPDSATVKPEANLRLMQRISNLLNVVHLAIAATYE